MSNSLSAGSNRPWYVLELFCTAASVLFQQPPELRNDPRAACQEGNGGWDPSGGGVPLKLRPIGTGALLVQAASERRFPQLIFIYLFILKRKADYQRKQILNDGYRMYLWNLLD